MPPTNDSGQDGPCPKGNAYKTGEGDDGTSVGLAEAIESKGGGPDSLVAECEDGDNSWGVLEISVGQIRELGFEVVQDGEAHALIKPPPSGGQSRKLTKASKWVQRPRWP
jgi:hypothetical protein